MRGKKIPAILGYYNIVIIANLKLWSIYIFKHDNINLHNNHGKETFSIKQLRENCEIMEQNFCSSSNLGKYSGGRHSE